MTDAVMGYKAKLAFDAATPFDTSSIPFEFLSCGLTATKNRIQSEGIRGTRSRFGERTADGLIDVGGSIVMNPSPAELDWLLPRILGADESTDTFAVADDLPEFVAMVDKVNKVYTYTGCKIGQATFTASAGQLVQLTLDIVGKTESEGNSGTFPAITVNLENCYVFHHGALTLHSSARVVNDFTLTINNALDVQFRNSQTASSIVASDRIVTLSCTVPYDSDNDEIYTNERGGTYASGSLVFTNGGYSTTFTLNSLRGVAVGPVVAGRNQELLLPLNYQAYQISTTKEIVVTHDAAA